MVAAAAVGDARACAATAPFLHGFLAGLNDFGVVVEAQIIIAAQEDHFPAIKPNMGAFLFFEMVVVRLVLESKLGNLVVMATCDDGIFLS